MCPLDELCFIHICHNRMSSTALHSMDINYSVVTKPKRNKHVLLKDLNVKQLNLWKTFWENRIYMQLCFNHPFVEYKPSTAKVIKHRHTILLTQVQETRCSIKFSCLTFFNMSVPFPKWWTNSEFQKTDGPCTISKASCLYSQCSLSQPILLRGQIKYIEENYWTEIQLNPSSLNLRLFIVGCTTVVSTTKEWKTPSETVILFPVGKEPMNWTWVDWPEGENEIWRKQIWLLKKATI